MKNTFTKIKNLALPGLQIIIVGLLVSTMVINLKQQKEVNSLKSQLNNIKRNSEKIKIETGNIKRELDNIKRKIDNVEYNLSSEINQVRRTEIYWSN